MNLTYDKTSLIESAVSLRNFTWDNLANITNVIDFHFIVTTIENYIPYLEREPEVCKSLKSVLSNWRDCNRMIVAVGQVFDRNRELCFEIVEEYHGEGSATAFSLLTAH